MVKYSLPRKMTWIELSTCCVVVAPQSAGEEALPSLGCSRRRVLWEKYIKAPARAAFETTAGELKPWLARGRGVRKDTDRQRILAGIFDRGLLRAGLAALSIHKLARDTKVRIEAIPSPWHEPNNHILVVRAEKRICCLMCCREGTETGNDPFPKGVAA